MRSKMWATALFLAVAPVGAAWAAPVPLLRYGFDEADNATASDQGSAPAADGSFVNGAGRTADAPAGSSRRAADFTAALGTTHGPAVTTGVDANKLDALGSMTVSLWVNLRRAPSKIALENLVVDAPAAGASGGTGGWRLRLFAPLPEENASNFGLGFTVEEGTEGNGVTARGLNADRRWLFVAATRAANGQTTLYSGTETAPAAPIATGLVQRAILDNNVPLYVGGAPGNGYTPPMWADDVRVYGAALTAAEINEVRLANVPEPGLASVVVAAAALVLSTRGRRRAAVR